MSSFRQKIAARLNGAKSKGPKTPEGKAIASLNAVRHGLTAKTIVLSNESQESFNLLRDGYIEEFQPQTSAEKDAVEEMIAAKWRMNRYLSTETALLDMQMDLQEDEFAAKFVKSDEPTRLAMAFKTLADNSNSLHLLDRYLAKHSVIIYCA